MFRFMIYFSTILTMIFFIGCSGTVDSETLTIDFQNSTVYESHYIGGENQNNPVLVRTSYNAVVKSNGLLMKDTTYTYNSMMLKIKTAGENTEYAWQLFSDFGTDTIFNVVKRETHDSIFVNYADTLYSFDVLSSQLTTAQFDSLTYPAIVSGHNFDSENENDSIAIATIDSLNTYPKSYIKFKEEIGNLYDFK